VGQEWPYPQLDEFDAERFAPIGHVYIGKFGGPSPTLNVILAPPSDINPLFYPHDGIMPFWQLSRILASV
jgi:hypothetical protein